MATLATDEEKSEFLKDLLAFTNANRHQDAYVIIGVTEERRITDITQSAELQPAADFRTLEMVQVVRNFVPHAPLKLPVQP